MEKFHLSERIKSNLVKLIKSTCKNNGKYYIVYVPPTFANPGKFNVTGITDNDMIASNNRGECHYKNFTFISSDTDSQIKNKIFGGK